MMSESDSETTSNAKHKLVFKKLKSRLHSIKLIKSLKICWVNADQTETISSFLFAYKSSTDTSTTYGF